MNKTLIQYQTHYVLTNKNSLTEINHQLRKIETPHPNNREQRITQKQKIDFENLKRIMNEQMTTFAINKKHSIENNQDGNEKINHVLTYIPIKIITDLNELINAGAKLVCEKIEVSLKNTNKNSKPGWEIRLEMQIKKKTTNTDKNDITKEKRWNMGQKEKRNTRKNNNTSWGNKTRNTGERSNVIKIPTKGETIQNRTFQNN